MLLWIQRVISFRTYAFLSQSLWKSNTVILLDTFKVNSNGLLSYAHHTCASRCLKTSILFVSEYERCLRHAYSSPRKGCNVMLLFVLVCLICRVWCVLSSVSECVSSASVSHGEEGRSCFHFLGSIF